MKELGPHHKTECKKFCKGGSILEIFKIKPIYVNSSTLLQTVLTQKNPGGGGENSPIGQEIACYFSQDHAMVTKLLDFIYKHPKY